MVEQSPKGQLSITTKPGDETWSMQQASWACRPPFYGILSRFAVKPAIPFIGLDSQALITIITSEVRSVFCDDSSISPQSRHVQLDSVLQSGKRLTSW